MHLTGTGTPGCLNLAEPTTGQLKALKEKYSGLRVWPSCK